MVDRVMVSFVTRFAPSPSGFLHLGHAYSALVAFNAARQAEGDFLLRIEDIDKGRCRPEFEATILEDLRWLGIDWRPPIRRQSDHLHEYDEALQKLIRDGLTYRCFKTRKEIAEEILRAPHLAPEGPEGPAFVGERLPPDEERALLQKEEPFAWRLSIARTKERLGPRFEKLFVDEEALNGSVRRRFRATPEIFGDVILGRKDSGTSYHLASVYDDAKQGVSHVIRGEDLRAAAHLHVLLQELLDLPHPVYRHHRLIIGENGKRLAKRDQAKTLKTLRENGATPSDVKRMVGLID
ncbi:MAG: tRNA glutamyl-Q(34) synthetase GluQRS [Parvularculaceae bacterium]